MLISLALTALLAPQTAMAQKAEEVVVVSNPFARWDGTRWLVRTQVAMPWSAVLYGENRFEAQFVAYDLQMVFFCNLAERVGPKAREAICEAQDASIQVAGQGVGLRGAQQVLDETTDRLSGMKLRMRVFDDGRVGSIALEGEPEINKRVNIQYENLRQLVRRAVLGFYYDAPANVGPGTQWIERDNPLFSLPSFRIFNNNDRLPDARGASTDGEATAQSDSPVVSGSSAAAGGLSTGAGTAVATDPGGVSGNTGIGISSIATGSNLRALGPVEETPNSIGSSELANTMAEVNGYLIVQTGGEGTVMVGEKNPTYLKGGMEGVAVFNRGLGFISERLWAITLKFTGGSGTLGNSGLDYFHKGSLRYLQPAEAVTLPKSAYVAPPGSTPQEGELPWPEM